MIDACIYSSVNYLIVIRAMMIWMMLILKVLVMAMATLLATMMTMMVIDGMICFSVSTHSCRVKA